MDLLLRLFYFIFIIFNRLSVTVLRRYLIIFVLNLFRFRAVTFCYYCSVYNKRLKVYVTLTETLRKSFIFPVKTIRILNFAVRCDKYKFINGTFILLFITFLNVLLYVPDTLHKYKAYLSFKFLITLTIFVPGLYYIIIPKLIINWIIIVYICLTQTALYFYVNITSLISANFYIINLIFKAFL